MKNFIWLILLMPFLYACEDNDINNSQIEVRNISFSNSEEDTTGTSNRISCIELTAKSDNYIQVKHNSTMFCCGTEKADINLQVLNDTILINEIDMGPYTYCFCYHDIEYEIGPLEFQSYILKIIGCETSYDRDTIIEKFNYSDNLYFSNCDCGYIENN